MADVPDLWASLKRLVEAVDGLDPRAPAVLAYHAAIERELDRAIARHLPKASRLKGLSFGHKVSVWASVQNVSDDLVQLIATPLLRFNDLRNAIAHGAAKREIDANFRNLLISIPATEGAEGTEANLQAAAAYIFGGLNSKVYWAGLRINLPDKIKPGK